MNTKGKIAIKESKTRISTAALMRLAGLSAMLAGLSIVVMGMFHPANEFASVTTPTWIIVHIFATSLGFFGVLGLAGLYARQVEKAGWLGLIGFLLFSALDGAGGALFFRRSRAPAAPGKRVPAVCDRLPGDVHRHSQRGEPRGLANDVEHLRHRC